MKNKKFLREIICGISTAIFLSLLFGIIFISIENYSLRQENDKLRAQMECDILNNCPLCGGEAEIQLVIDNYYIDCNDCGLHTDYFKSKDELIKYWNK